MGRGPIRRIRGIRDRIPGGFVIGRLGQGTGAPQLIPISPDAGTTPNPGNPSVGGSGGGSGVAANIQSLLDGISAVAGTILIRTSSWVGLAIGTAKQYVRVNSGATSLEYVDAPYDVAFYVFDTPTANVRIWYHIVTRAFTIADDFANSHGYAITAPSGSTVFTVKRNGSSIGSFTFALSANTCTFATTGSGLESFAVGDRLEVFSPAALNGLADLAVTFKGVRND